ncbi:LysR family transcriptional regulator [Pygmaiobacter massiliensis]|uniref:LysR family transcriptional regulator n=1 Tax=Pygmaiobacter massiliensis TaxID=1917873 RepID=UPI0015E0F315|nr:LysR family transcriptional regulator [Pygmaiobacter massiliensis]
MTLVQLRYVIEVAKTGSINKAASNLFLSQSVLSTAIMNLEKEVGHEIFMRNNRGVSLTPFGHTFTSYISAIQTQLQQLDTLIKRGDSSHTFSFSVASMGFYFLNHICADLYKKYHAVGVRIEDYEDHENNIADMVASQMVELGFVRIWSCYKNSYVRQLHSKKLQYYPIAKLEIAITVGPKCPLYSSESDTVAANELKKYPAVMYANIDSGPYSDIYERLHLPIASSRFVTSSRSTIYEMLGATDCYYLNSAYPFERMQKGFESEYSSLRTLKLANSTIFSEMAWIKREDATLSPIAHEVISRVMEFFSENTSLEEKPPFSSNKNCN